MRKILFISCLIIFTNQISNAKILIEKLSSKDEDPVYAKISINNKEHYWITSRQIINENKIYSQMRIESMNCSKNIKPKLLKIPETYLIINPLSQSKILPPLIASMDSKGTWSIHQLRKNLSSVKKSKKLQKILSIKSIFSTSNVYLIGGTDYEKRPFLQLLNQNLKTIKNIKHTEIANGEISQILENKEHIAIIFNAYKNQTDKKPKSPEIWIHSKDGESISRTRLNGIGVYAAEIENGEFAISYWENNVLHVERRNNKMEIIWVLKLHERKGIASDTGQLLMTGNEIAWIGANEDRLLIHRISKDGKIIYTKIDKESNIKVPVAQNYSAQSYGNELHIRGTFYENTPYPYGKFMEFCLIDHPEK